MRNSITTITLFALLTLLIGTVDAQNLLPVPWTVSSSTDEMSGEKRWVVRSPIAEPTRTMSFPYEDTHARLLFVCDNDGEWVNMNFNEAPNATNTTTRDGYNIVHGRVSFNGNVSDIDFIQTWGDPSMTLRRSGIGSRMSRSEFIQNLIRSNELLVEIAWYGSGNVRFKFPLDGSANAINRARNNCRNQR